MFLAKTVKHASIELGMFRQALNFSRRLRPASASQFLGDIRLYKTVLPPGALCFDVGANLGSKSEALLEAGMQVVAFEPNPQLLPELRARCGYSPRWSLVPTAMGSGPGIATLHIREAHGLSSLDEGWQDGGKPIPVVDRCHVPVVTLDAAIESFGRPFFCKIDVEGWELEVLKGLTQPIPLVSFEFHLLDNDIRKASACLKRLLDLGMGHVNIIPGEGTALHYPKWVALSDFAKQFPAGIKSSLPGNPKNLYGDIFVKMPDITLPART